jgi:hypothetical protein
VRPVAQQALLSLGHPYALEVPPEVLEHAGAWDWPLTPRWCLASPLTPSPACSRTGSREYARSQPDSRTTRGRVLTLIGTVCFGLP